jgi:hypothetical protein
VSVSLGDTARFLFGGLKRKDPVEARMLESGDAFVFGGAARLRYHGVSRIIPGTAPSAARSCRPIQPHVPSVRRVKREAALVVFAFACLSAIATFPLVLHLGRALPGDLGDPLFSSWVLGWDAERLRHGLSGFWDAPILFPQPPHAGVRRASARHRDLRRAGDLGQRQSDPRLRRRAFS